MKISNIQFFVTVVLALLAGPQLQNLFGAFVFVPDLGLVYEDAMFEEKTPMMEDIVLEEHLELPNQLSAADVMDKYLEGRDKNIERESMCLQLVESAGESFGQFRYLLGKRHYVMAEIVTLLNQCKMLFSIYARIAEDVRDRIVQLKVGTPVAEHQEYVAYFDQEILAHTELRDRAKKLVVHIHTILSQKIMPT